MRAAELLPAGDVGHEHARADDVPAIGPQLLQRPLDELQTAPRLPVRVARRVHALARFVDGRSTRHVDVPAGAQRAAVADLALPDRVREGALEFHRLTSGIGRSPPPARRSSRGCGTPGSARAWRRAPPRAPAACRARSPARPWRAIRAGALFRPARPRGPCPALSGSIPGWPSARRGGLRARPPPPRWLPGRAARARRGADRRAR